MPRLFGALRPEVSVENARSAILSMIPLPGTLAHRAIDVRASDDMASFHDKNVEVKPGGLLRLKQEDFGRWYQCKENGAYSFLGMYEVSLYSTQSASQPSWVDWRGDKFSIVIDE